MDIQGESAKPAIKSLVRVPVAEGLTQLSSNHRVFLDPGCKVASDPFFA